MQKQFILITALTAILLISIFAYQKSVNHSDNSESHLLRSNEVDVDLMKLWEDYQRDFKFHFDDSEEEEIYRFQIFCQNYVYIQNKPGLSITQYMHLTQDEFEEQTFGIEEPTSNSYDKVQSVSQPLQTIDWVAKGAVTPVKNQGMCASSWAFSVTGGIESALFLKKGVLTSLSEQNFLDCDQSNKACDGGDRSKALKFVMEKGLSSSTQNPYKAYKGKCKLITKQAYTITGFKEINNCNDLYAALQSAPISIAIDGSDIQFYKSGILNAGYKSRSFGALLVGFDSEQGYWKIKTSLGPKFGESGYIRLAAEIKDGMVQNTAGICDRAFQIQA